MADIELFDTSDIHDDAERWDAFAARVSTGARKQRDSVLQWLAGSRAAVVSIALVLGALAIVLAASEDVQSGTTAREQWRRLLAPSDAVGRTIATGNQPPTIDRLLDEARGGSR